MSLIGIDVGSSSVKVCAYSMEGAQLAGASRASEPLHPGPGLWEQDPLKVWGAVKSALTEIASLDALKHDPPIALAVSASGRENFPMTSGGVPLANNIMGADIRGEELERVPEGVIQPEGWELACGHLRERMDPVYRYLWWNSTHPELIERAEL